MAGAGFKTFNTGDVLTASDVNTYLMQQTVMVFDDASARSTALPSPSEGMFSYLKDTNLTYRYDGSAWLSDAGTTSPLTTKGDVWGYSTADARIPVGADGTVLTADSAEALGVKWATPTSKVVQIVNATDSTQTILASSTFADSNLSASITPTSASNKILVFVTHSGCGKYNSNTGLQVRLLRDSTTILNIEANGGSTASTAGNLFGSIAASYLDSPATTSATTYKTQIASQANTGSAYINDSTSPGSASTITLMEVTP